MPLGSPALYLANAPHAPYVIDPPIFNRTTSKEIFPVSGRKAWPGYQQSVEFELKSEGIVSEVRIYFEGEMAGAGAGPVDPLWGHKIADKIQLAVGGKVIQEASGAFYHVFRFVKNAALQRNTEFYSSQPDENGRFRCLWVIPVASDPVTLAGAIWAQSDTIEVTIKIETPTSTKLDLSGAPVITGNFWAEETVFEVPWHPEKAGHIVIPDLSRLHGIISKKKAIAQVGEEEYPLRKVQATLMRLFTYINLGAANDVANPVNYAVLDPDVEGIEFQFAASDAPFRFRPAWGLAARNSEHYGAPLPLGWTVIDLVKENGPRDIGLRTAMTDPRLVVDIRDGATLNTSHAKVEHVQQVQYVRRAA